MPYIMTVVLQDKVQDLVKAVRYKTSSIDGQNKGPQTDAQTWATKTTGQVRVTAAGYLCSMKDPVKGWGETPSGEGT